MSAPYQDPGIADPITTRHNHIYTVSTLFYDERHHNTSDFDKVFTMPFSLPVRSRWISMRIADAAANPLCTSTSVNLLALPYPNLWGSCRMQAQLRML